MKFINQLTASLVGLGLIATAAAQNNQAPKFKLPDAPAATTPAQPAAPVQPATTQPAAPAAPAVVYTQAQLMEAYGITLAARATIKELEFTPADVDAIAKGMKMVLTGEEPTYANDAQSMNQQLSELMAQKNQNLHAKIKAANIAITTEFFNKVKANKEIQFQTSGLGIETLKAGTGATAKLGQLLKFHYTLATIPTGEVISTSAGQQPLEAILQEGALLPGMLEGLQKVAVGGKVRLYIPYKLAEGEDGGQRFLPAQSIIFEIELLEVKDAPPAAK